jgi:inhibitor of cysteine peptidase
MRRLLFCAVAVAAACVPLSGAAGGAAGAGERTAAAGKYAAQYETAASERVTPGPELPVWLAGKKLEFSPPAATVNGTLFVPASQLAEALGVKGEYLDGGNAPTGWKASYGGTTLEFRAGATTMELNGVKRALPAAAYVDDGRLYIPLRTFAEAFGYIVRWDALQQAVVIEPEWTALPAVGTEAKLQELLASTGMAVGGGLRVMAIDQKEKSAAADYSGTNVQVAGVDEGDLIKTDGRYLYQVSGRRLVLTRIAPASDMKVASTVTFDDAQFAPHELYVDGDKLVVVGRSQKPGPNAAPSSSDSAGPAWQAAPADSAPAAAAASPRTKSVAALPFAAQPATLRGIMPAPFGSGVTKAIVYDITDRSKPHTIRTVELEGEAVATRKIGSVVYLVTNAPAYGLLSAKTRSGAAAPTPSYRDSADGEDWRNVELPKIRYFPAPIRPNYLLIGGFDLARPSAPLTLSSFLGAGEHVYVSQKSLYVAQTQYEQTPRPADSAESANSAAAEGTYVPTTAVYRFQLDGGSVRYASKGSVPGTPLNQFSMDEYDDVFRIATTRQDGNALYTLDESMQTIGRLEKLAPGERIYSARFMEGRAYLVTFRQVDPLFVIDVSDPRTPQVLGTLKIPGYSDYLHPYDATHLIGFGKETVQDKSGTVLYQGMKVSLFDVSDVSRPIELFKTDIGDRGTESDLLQDHKALLFSKEKGLLAFPVAVREAQATDGYKDPHQYGALTFQGAYVYHVDLRDGFRLRGRVTHLSAQDRLKAGYDSYDPAYLVKRALYVGDTLYTVSDGAVKANDLATLGEVGELRFGE